MKCLLRDRCDSATHLASFGRPVLVAVVERDAVVPAPFSAALHEGLPAPKRLAGTGGTGHNDWIEHLEQGWWREAALLALGDIASL